MAEVMHRVFGIVSYEVKEQVSRDILNRFGVKYDHRSNKVKCQCLMFESRGILCRHSLMVLSHERVDRVFSRYILDRWSKTVKRNHTNIRSNVDDPVLDERGVIYKGLLSRSYEMVEFGSESRALASILRRAYDKAYTEMVEFKAKEKEVKTVTIHQEGSLDGMNELLSPTRVRSRGRPKKRLGSTLEKQIASNKKRKAVSSPNVENSRLF